MLKNRLKHGFGQLGHIYRRAPSTEPWSSSNVAGTHGVLVDHSQGTVMEEGIRPVKKVSRKFKQCKKLTKKDTHA